jgi:hypothetical protein
LCYIRRPALNYSGKIFRALHQIGNRSILGLSSRLSEVARSLLLCENPRSLFLLSLLCFFNQLSMLNFSQHPRLEKPRLENALLGEEDRPH